MKPNQTKLFYLFSILSLFIISCGGGGEKKEESATNSEFDAAKEQLTNDVNSVIANLPPPSEVPYLLMGTGADFDETMLNTLDKVNSYEKNKAKAALNLGVYGVDIAYLCSYEQSEKALEYMNESQSLAAPIGVADAIDLGMVARFEKNMENKDSLAAITNAIMKTTGDRLGELEEVESAALLLAGSWIEGIFLSTSIVANYPEDLPESQRTLTLVPVVKVIIDQKGSLKDLMKVLADVPNSENTAAISTSLEKVNEIYNGEFLEIEKQIAENTGDFILKPEMLNNLIAEIATIRAGIVE